MESYNESIANNPKTELIHLSQDGTSDAAAAWAKKANMPWPTLMKDDIDTDFLEPYGITSLPTYILVDRDGKAVATGKHAAFAKIKEMDQ